MKTTLRQLCSVSHLAERLYPLPELQDPALLFVRHIESIVTPNMVVLDLGAGAGRRNRYALQGKVRRLIGVDLDEQIVSNDLVDERIRADICRLPFPENCFDLIFSVYVIEHVIEPELLLREIARVLKPGGCFVFLTPNTWHYVALISRLTPTGFHTFINEQRGRPTADTFPTVYRMNSARAIRNLVRSNTPELVVQEIRFIESRPNYLMFSLPTFILGACYERIVNSNPLLAPLRVNILCSISKEGFR